MSDINPQKSIAAAAENQAAGDENVPGGRSGTARIALRGTVWVSLSNYLTQLIGFVSMLVLARLLAPELFGYFALAGFWSSVLSLRAKAGLGYAAIQQKETSGALLGTYFLLDAILTLLTIILAVVASVVLLYLKYPTQVVMILGVMVACEVISLIGSPLYMSLERELQLSRIGLVSLIGYSIAYLVSIGFALSGRGIVALISVNLVYGVLATCGVFIIARNRIPHVFHMRWTISKPLAKELLVAGITAGLSATALSTVVGQFDNFLIGTFVSATTLGFYDRAYRITQWPNILIGFVISKAGFLTFAKVKDDLARLTHTVRLMFWVLTSLSVCISIWLFFSAPDLITVLLTDKWLPSTAFVRFLSVTNFLWGFVSLGFWLSVALGHKRATLTLTFLQATILVVVATPLTLIFGSNGTLVGVGASMAIGSVASCIYVFRQVDLQPAEVFLRPLTAAIITIVLLWVVTNLTIWNTFIPVVRVLLTGIGVSILIVSFLYLLNPSEMRLRLQYLIKTWRPA